MPEATREEIEQAPADPDPVDYRVSVICKGDGGPRRRMVDLDHDDGDEEWIDCDRADLVDVGGAQ